MKCVRGVNSNRVHTHLTDRQTDRQTECGMSTKPQITGYLNKITMVVLFETHMLQIYKNVIKAFSIKIIKLFGTK